MSNSSPKMIKREESFSPSRSLTSHGVEEPELSTIEETHTIPDKAAKSISCDGGSHRSARAGLLQAMMRYSASRTAAQRDKQPDGFRISQSSNSNTLGKRLRDAVQDESDGQYLDDSDSNSARGRQSARVNTQQSCNSQLLSRQSPATGSIETPESKKRRRVEEEQQETKVYHDECRRRNIAPKFLYEGERQALGILKYKPWLKAAQQSSNRRNRSLSGSFTFPSSPLSQVSRIMIEADTMSVKDRKRFFIYTPTESMQAAMQADVSRIHRLFPPTRKISDCMLHPNPGGLLKDGKYSQVIQLKYTWRDTAGPHIVRVNFGLVALIVNSHLTAAQKEGFIEHAWHLSHLCGNWICCNWRHHTVEPGPVNIGRNACFNSSEQCTHKPPCMKDKKQVLSLPTTPASTTSQKGLADSGTELCMHIEDGQEDEEPGQADDGIAFDSEDGIRENLEVIVLSSGEDTDAEASGSDEEEE